MQPPSETVPYLSDHERSVVQLVAEEHPNKEIARKLLLTEHTVKNHLRSIFKRLRVSNRRDLLSGLFGMARSARIYKNFRKLRSPGILPEVLQRARDSFRQASEHAKARSRYTERNLANKGSLP